MVIYSTIQNFPKQFLTSWQIAAHVDLGSLQGKRFRQVYYVGMGGSSLPGDLINDCFRGECHLQIIRSYQLPKNANHEDLAIFSSFSGNTEETIHALEDGIAKGCSIAVLSHGGKLKTLALKQDLPYIPIPDCIQPRCATGYFFASLLGLLSRLGLLASKEEELHRLSEYLESMQSYCESEGQKIAVALNQRIPMIYGPEELYGACRIWKIKLNENAKIQSFFNVFPELNHNEMVGFTQLLMNPTIIYLKSQWSHPRILQRMATMKWILEQRIPFYELKLLGRDLLEETFISLLVADYASYYLAKKYGVDPTPVDMVEDFKKRLKYPL